MDNSRSQSITTAGRLEDKLVVGLPIYYGWVIMAAAIVGRIMTSPGQTYAVAIFIEHFIKDLGVSRSMVSTLYTVGTLIASFSLPFVGRQIDRRGPRLVVSVVSVLLALACFYMGMIQNALMLGIGFVLVRMLGQGSLQMVNKNVVNLWWVRRRGMIMGIYGVIGWLLGNGAFPSLVHSMIDRFGWRISYVLMGLAVLVIMLPVGWLFYRRQPEDYGLLPDGAKAPAERASAGAPDVVEENWTSQEAIRTPAFWIISLAGASIAMLSTGLQFHMVSVFEDAGLSASAAAAAFMPIALTSAALTIVGGVLSDRLPVRFLMVVALIGQAASLVMAPRLTGTTTALIYGVLLGITGSLEQVVNSVVWAKYFGRRHLGAITGIASLVLIAGSSLGPMPMGIARDLLGNYTLALTVAAVLPLALAVLTLFARRPQRQHEALLGESD